MPRAGGVCLASLPDHRTVPTLTTATTTTASWLHALFSPPVVCLLAVRALRPQVCHDLELFRCYASEADRKRMDRKLACLAVEIGKDATEELKGFALDALSQTGDRILYAPMKGKKTQRYIKGKFVPCMTEPRKCLDVVGAAIYGSAWSSAADPTVCMKMKKRPLDESEQTPEHATSGKKKAKTASS